MSLLALFRGKKVSGLLGLLVGDTCGVQDAAVAAAVGAGAMQWLMLALNAGLRWRSLGLVGWGSEAEVVCVCGGPRTCCGSPLA